MTKKEINTINDVDYLFNSALDSLKVILLNKMESFKYNDRVKSLFIKSIENDFIYRFFNTNELGAIELDSVFSDGEMSCKASFLIGQHNFLIFRDGQSVCVIIQQFGLIDGIYFPKDNILIQCLGGPAFKNCIPNYVNYISKKDVTELSEYLTSEKEVSYILGHTRPYHYFYEQLPAFEMMYPDLMLNKRVVYTKKGWDFFGIDKLFVGANISVVSDINTENFKYNRFSVRLCVRKNRTSIKRYEQLDSRLLTCSSITDYTKLIEVTKVYKCLQNKGLVIWFGITGQKRSWLSQVEGITKIIEHYSKQMDGNITAIIDGWTSHVNVTPELLSEDLNVFKSIEESLKGIPVNLINIIGWNSSEKISIGQHVNLFLTNHASGSLHISRICSKSGVTHLNTLMNKNQYIHHNALEIDRIENIVTSNEAMNNSYDFDWRIVIEKFNYLLTD